MFGGDNKEDGELLLTVEDLEKRLPSDLWVKVLKSLEVIKTVFNSYKLAEVALSFNGGKDSTVLLHLLHLILSQLHSKDNKPCSKILSVYFEDEKPFAEVTEFINLITTRYGLQLKILHKSIKDGLQELKDSGVKAIFSGTRRTDPFSANLKDQTMTDTHKGWAEMTRVHPILDWDYQDVWTYLRVANVPYCCLYDHGYTSLGGKDNTQPNPYLKTEQGYEPAWKLKDGSQERHGRSKSKIFGSVKSDFQQSKVNKIVCSQHMTGESTTGMNNFMNSKN